MRKKERKNTYSELPYAQDRGLKQVTVRVHRNGKTFDRFQWVKRDKKK